MFSARLRAYAPEGSPLGYLPDPLGGDLSVVNGEPGALTLQYTALAAGGEHIMRPLEDGLEVALELWDDQIDTWVEPRGCRFVRLDQGADQADDTEVQAVRLVSYGWLLSKMLLVDGTFTNGRRVFTGETADGILSTLLSENATYGGPDMTLVEEPGVWPVLADQGFDYGTDYLAVLRGLQEAGALDWTTLARGLYVYQADSANLSPDLSSSVRLVLGRDIGNAPADESIEQLASGVAVRASAGGTVLVEEPTAPTPHGKWLKLLSIGQVDDQTAAEAMGQADLERSGRVRQQYTRELILHDGAPRPLLDYWPGAWITAPTNVPSATVRVQQLTLTWGPDGLGGNVVLNDRFLEGDIRQARKLGAVLPGQVGSGGAPPPISVDPEASRIPSVPAGLTTDSEIVWVGSIPRGVVTASWDLVNTGTDSGPMVIAGYELQWRANGGDWQSIFTAEISAEIRDLTPGDSVETRVRAVGARTTLPSAWSGTVAEVVPGDVTPPSVPSTPTVDSRLGFVNVTWDGLSDTAQPMEVDFARVEIAVGETSTPTTVEGFLTREGMAPIAGQTYGSTVQVRLRSVDTSGNASAWSTASDPIVVKAVTGPDLAANSVNANNINAGAVSGIHLAGQIILGSLIKTSEDGQRVEMDEGGLRLYDDSGNLRVDLPTTPGEDARFRGAVEADGLVVRQGATFYSPLNEFAQDSTINLAEQVQGPAEPWPTFFWDYVTLEQVAYTDTLGTFALDPEEIVGVGRDFRSGEERILVFQYRGTGTRMWFYELDGTLSPMILEGEPHPFEDWEDWLITGGIFTDTPGPFVWFGQYIPNDNWYFRLGHTGSFHELLTGNVSNRVAMGWDGTDVLTVDRAPGGFFRLRRVDTSTNPVTELESVTSTEEVSSAQLNFVFKGAADFGSTQWVTGQENSIDYRTFSTGGSPTFSSHGWKTPQSRVGAFWNAADSLFYTVSSAGRLYKHSNITWSDPALTPWHMGQVFVDDNAAGTGTHTTELANPYTFNMIKRANVRLLLQDVPYSGEDDDPNGWQVYGKRGTAPLPDLSDMTLQGSGAYTENTFDMVAVPTTGGASAPTVNTFPQSNPAVLRSQRTFVAEPTVPIFEVRGDGSGHWGPFVVYDDGSYAWEGDSTGWMALTLGTGWSHVETLSTALVGGTVFISGRVQATGGSPSNTVAQLNQLFPSATTRSVAWDHSINDTRLVSLFTSGVLQSPGATTGRELSINFSYPRFNP